MAENDAQSETEIWKREADKESGNRAGGRDRDKERQLHEKCDELRSSQTATTQTIRYKAERVLD